jgi:hypothetical protein
MDKQLRSMQKTHQLQKILNVKNHKIFNCIVNSQLCTSGCSNKEWIKNVVCQGILLIERGFSEKCPLSQ